MCNWILEISAAIFTSDNDLYYFEKQLARDPNEIIQEVMCWHVISHIARYSESQLSRDVRKVVSLLPEDGTEIQIKDLRAGLNAYGFDTQYQNKILKETGENHRDIEELEETLMSMKIQ